MNQLESLSVGLFRIPVDMESDSKNLFSGLRLLAGMEDAEDDAESTISARELNKLITASANGEDHKVSACFSLEV